MTKNEAGRRSGGEEKTVALCVKCAKMYGEAYTLRKVSGGVDHKITCDGCRKRRFGAEYAVKRRADDGTDDRAR